MPATERLARFWQGYCERLPAEHPHRGCPAPPAWGFGDSPELADELGHLVLIGRKRATTTMLEELLADGELLPEPGELNIILDGRGRPLCLIETTQVEVLPFDSVDERFAADEGEGDGSLAYWQAAHRSYFGRVANRLGTALRSDTPVVCERFHVLHARQPRRS